MNSTIYIRKENQEKWERIANKSAYINSLLEQESLAGFLGHELNGKMRDEGLHKVEKVLKTTNLTNEIGEKLNFCPNGHPMPIGRERCLGKVCKYSK